MVRGYLVTLNQRSMSSTRSRSSKNEKCGKLAETCGELKILFSKFPYKIDMFGGLSHFVVAQHWCKGAMIVRVSRYLLCQVRELTWWSLFM